ncbi:cell division protein FtsX [Desulfonatronovibrio hydrogenovorans]|uniref:cell division protein FtsX n=1 Tax=Desulfonatronovibrio hydrogenovorans TaxID=53245 RepID=UPI00048DAC25|nr:permease-like cell division protein FtsX [Desulfonatronovibrio hydrogenovorans]
MRVFRQLAVEGLLNLGRNKWAQVFTMSAVTFVSFLAGLFLLILFNFNLTVQATQDSLQYQVYWSKGTDPEQVREQWSEINSWDVISVKTFTPEQALEALMDSMPGGFDPAGMAGVNPLPFTALVEFSLTGEQADDRAGEILKRIEQFPGVERVSYNPMQMDLAKTWLRVTSGVFWPLIGLMLLITGLVVANTLKLNQINRKEEIEILSLVGASTGYIQFPLLITGALQGLGGGTLAVVLLKAIHLMAKDLLYFPPVWIRIEFFPPVYVISFLAVLTGVGIMSSFLAGQNRKGGQK